MLGRSSLFTTGVLGLEHADVFLSLGAAHNYVSEFALSQLVMVGVRGSLGAMRARGYQ